MLYCRRENRQRNTKKHTSAKALLMCAAPRHRFQELLLDIRYHIIPTVTPACQHVETNPTKTMQASRFALSHLSSWPAHADVRSRRFEV